MVSLLGHSRLAVGSSISVNDALGNSNIELLGSQAKFFCDDFLVASGDGITETANRGLDRRTGRLVTKLCLLVGLNTLDLRLDICHFELLSSGFALYPWLGLKVFTSLLHVLAPMVNHWASGKGYQGMTPALKLSLISRSAGQRNCQPFEGKYWI